MSETGHADRSKHEHKGKSSEQLLDIKGILNNLSISEGQTILDAGCGNGYMAKELAKLVKSTGKVYAMDIDEAAIEKLGKTVGTDTIEPIVGNITTKTNLKESSIDLVYIANVMHGLSETQIAGFIAETRRLLKPGGILAVIEFKKEESSSGPPMNIRISPAELKEIIPLTPIRTTDTGQYSYLQLFQR